MNLKVDKDRLKGFLDSELKSKFILEAKNHKTTPSLYVPPRVEPSSYEGFSCPFLSSPTTVDIFLTRACNLKCSHCFSEGGKPLKNELSFEEWISVLDQLEEMAVLQVRLNGGEPFMRRRIYDILSHLEHKRYRKVMLTNGTLLNDKAIDALLSSDVTPTLSLDGATAKVHDDFRGVLGAFNRTLKAMKLLQERGITYGLNTCVHSENIGQIEDIIRLGIQFGAARIGLLGLAEVGRLAMTKKNIVSGPEYLMFSLKLVHLVRKYKGKIDVAEEIISKEPPLDSVGIFTCSIDSDGGVYPSNRVLGESRSRMGSVREATLREIWFSRLWIPFRRGLKKSKTLIFSRTAN
ncbi:MAG: radical SAM protein [Nitrososphaerales archaeon]|nr:radical SAM protein [Nitrososphaerales archaeon]